MAGCTADGKSYSSCTITVIFDGQSNGKMTVTGQNKGDQTASVLFTGLCVVGGRDTPTPTGNFHASRWEKDHVSSKHLAHEDVPYSKTRFGDNAFGPYQLHILELETRGIYIHGTIDPHNNPFTFLNRLVSPASHGCVRMSNYDITKLHTMMPSPKGNQIILNRTHTQ
jgi:lipoprotein-anchoring transpeptidase ErfK/SrfK